MGLKDSKSSNKTKEISKKDSIFCVNFVKTLSFLTYVSNITFCLTVELLRKPLLATGTSRLLCRIQKSIAGLNVRARGSTNQEEYAMKDLLKRLLVEEEGQGITEYALILGLVVFVFG